MKLITSLFASILIPVMVCSQINEGAFDDYLYFVNQNRPTYEGVEGTPYLSDSFIPARIDSIGQVAYIKLNVFANNVEFKKTDGRVALLSLEKDYRFKLLDGSNVEYEIHAYKNEKGKKSRTFFKKVHTGKNYILFLKENVRFTPKKIATSGFEQNQPAKFTNSQPTYYVTNAKGGVQELVPVPTRKKEISTIFKEKAKEVQQLVKKQKLKLDRKEDLIKLFDFYWPEN